MRLGKTPAQIKCLLGFGIAKLALTVEQWERTVLQGSLELSEAAVEEDRADFSFYPEEKINLIWMLFRLYGPGFLKVN